MVIGRVDWFGGRNRNQVINNYGYITPVDIENTQGVYVHRDNIPVYVQEIIEGKQGKGVYVQFEIERGCKGRQAVDIELITAVGTVDWFAQGRGYINCEGRPDVRFTSSDTFDSNDILYFGIKYNHKLKEDEAILIYKIDNFTEDTVIIKKCAQNSNPKIFKNFLVQFVKTLSVEQALPFVTEKIKLLEERDKKRIIYELLDKSPNIVIASSELRDFLSLHEYDLNSYGYIIDKYLNIVDKSLKQDLLDELIAKVGKASDSKRSIYWNQVKYLQQHLEYKGFLWDIAPLDYKKRIIQDKFRIFFELISQYKDSDYPYASAISSDWRNLYKFDEADKILIEKWDSSVLKNSFKASQMISARGAEKLVIQFYENLGYTVEDISIHQVTSKSQDWIKGDVRLDSLKLLDVKNATTCVNAKVYSEFCVPAFKKYRGNDVKIVGVLSPYIKKEEIDGIMKPSSYRDNQEVLVLGAFNKAKLKELETLFSDRLISIDMSRNFDPNTYLPHWLFDYNDRFYVKQLELISQFQKLQDTEIPTWQDISIIDWNSIPLFITAKRRLPQDWLDGLPLWKATFINSLINLPVARISLPYLFLSLLRHFLSMLSYDSSDYSPQKYQDLLYMYNTNYPLKLYDPLNTITDFCKTLQILWENRRKVNLTEFKIFKFNGRGLLQGKRTQEEMLPTTILAYCGGWVEKKGKCGFTPLVIGQHENCPTCNRLICAKEDCRHCQDDCPSFLERTRRNISRISNWTKLIT